MDNLLSTSHLLKHGNVIFMAYINWQFAFFPCQCTLLDWGKQRMVLKLELSVPFMVSRGEKPLGVIDLGWNTHNPSNNPKFLTNASEWLS